MSKSIFFTEKSQIVPLQPSCWHICSLGPCFETSIDKNIYRYCNDYYDLLWHIVWWVFFRELIFNWICSIRYRHSGNLIHGSKKNSKKEDDFIYTIWKTVSNIRVTHFLLYVVDGSPSSSWITPSSDTSSFPSSNFCFFYLCIN